MADDEMLFAVLAEKEGEGRALFLHGLTISRLYEHIVVPYEEDRPFFVDGVPVDRKSLRRIKIVRQDQQFTMDLDRLHNSVKNPRTGHRHVPIADYPGRLLALFQEQSADVTSDIINAYREKKRLRVPTDKLIEAASQIAVAAIKAAG